MLGVQQAKHIVMFERLDNTIFFSIRFLFFILLAAAMLSGCSVNGQEINSAVFLDNLARSYNSIYRLLNAWAYMCGMLFITMSIFQLKIYGEMRTMMSGQTNLMKPISFFLVGAMLMYLPSTFQTMMLTTFGSASSNPMSWSNVTEVGINGYQLAITPALLGLMRIIGLISFIRGWIILVHVSEQGQHSTLSKGLTHILGGLFLINIVGTTNILWNLITVG